MILAGCGFAVPKQAAARIAALATGLPAGDVPALLPEMLSELIEAPDPGAALAGLASLIEADRSGTLAGSLAAGAGARRVLAALLGSSRAFTAALVRRPEWAGEMLVPGALEAVPAREELDAELDGKLSAAPDLAARLDALRLFRRRHSIRIAARDVSGRADLAGTVAEISAVADAVIAGALRLAREACDSPDVPLAVLALGKLGGRELNYSSDIDLLFITDRAGPEAHRLAGELARILSEPTAEGVAYRVDLRLRPEGSRGALVWPLESALEYYRTRARPWERQALVKCRPAAGDIELGARLLAGLEDFIWQPGMSAAEVARACRLRSEMERAADSARRNGTRKRTRKSDGFRLIRSSLRLRASISQPRTRVSVS